MAKIESIVGHEIFDAQGNKAVQVLVTTTAGTQGLTIALVSDVQTALHSIATEIQAALLGRDTIDQRGLDRKLLELNAVSSQQKIGLATLHAVSCATARSEAIRQGLPFYLYIKQLFPKRPLLLPIPSMTMLERHDGLLRQCVLIPQAVTMLPEAIEMGRRVYQAISKNTEIQHSASIDTIFSILTHAAEQEGFTPGKDLLWGIRLHGKEVDELYRTSRERYSAVKLDTEVILKASSLGTITETLQIILQAQEAKKVVGITTAEDIAVVDIAVATGVAHIQLGIPRHAENIMHYNRLLTIYTETSAPLWYTN